VVTCDNMMTLSGDSIDRSLPESSREDFHHHLSLCRPCRRSYELELVTHQTIRRTIRMVPTPLDVRRSVLDAVESELSPLELLHATLLTLLHGLARPAVLASGLAVVAFLFFFPQRIVERHNGQVQTAGIDILQVVADNLQRVRKGELQPSAVAENAAGVHAFFIHHGVSFPATVTLPGGFDSYGAVLTHHDNIPMAHIICTAGDDVMYVFEVLDRDMRTDADLCLTAKAREQLQHGRCYADTGIYGKQVVVWKEQETICAAASTMEMETLLEKLGIRNAKSGR